MTKYRIKELTVKSGDRYYIIQKKGLIFWKTYSPDDWASGSPWILSTNGVLYESFEKADKEVNGFFDSYDKRHVVSSKTVKVYE